MNMEIAKNEDLLIMCEFSAKTTKIALNFAKHSLLKNPIQPENLGFGIALFATGAPPDLEIFMDIARYEDLEIMYAFSAN